VGKMKQLLLPIIFVVCFTGIAHSQGNWVLWQHVTEGNNDYWYIEEAFPSYDLCKTSLSKKLVFNEVHDKDYTLVHWGNNGFMTTRKGLLTLVEFLCLPDTIDPRK